MRDPFGIGNSSICVESGFFRENCQSDGDLFIEGCEYNDLPSCITNEHSPCRNKEQQQKKESQNMQEMDSNISDNLFDEEDDTDVDLKLSSRKQFSPSETEDETPLPVHKNKRDPYENRDLTKLERILEKDFHDNSIMNHLKENETTLTKFSGLLKEFQSVKDLISSLEANSKNEIDDLKKSLKTATQTLETLTEKVSKLESDKSDVTKTQNNPNPQQAHPQTLDAGSWPQYNIQPMPNFLGQNNTWPPTSTPMPPQPQLFDNTLGNPGSNMQNSGKNNDRTYHVKQISHNGNIIYKYIVPNKEECENKITTYEIDSSTGTRTYTFPNGQIEKYYNLPFGVHPGSPGVSILYHEIIYPDGTLHHKYTDRKAVVKYPDGMVVNIDTFGNKTVINSRFK